MSTTSFNEYLMTVLNDKEKQRLIEFQAHTKKHWDDFREQRGVWKQTAKGDEKSRLLTMEGYPRVPGGITGADTTYTIIPGGLGMYIKVKCNVHGCVREDDLTDYESW
jgi:hypothetical protein